MTIIGNILSIQIKKKSSLYSINIEKFYLHLKLTFHVQNVKHSLKILYCIYFLHRLTGVKNILELKYCIIGVGVNEVKTCPSANRGFKDLLLQFFLKNLLSP